VDIDQAVQIVQEFAGLSPVDAKKLVQAVLQAAEAEAIELMSGEAPVPSNMADARALRLRYICAALGRTLRPLEVEVVFRLAPSTAAAVFRRMQSTYPRAIDPFLKAVVRDSATVTKTGNAEAGLRFQIFFADPAALDYAYQLLQRKGLTKDVKIQRAAQTFDLPRKIGSEDVLQVLGLPEP
jgi:hypothetical protein